MVFEDGVFLLSIGLQHLLKRRTSDLIRRTFCGRSLLPEARNTTRSGEGTRLWKLRGMNGWQRTPRSEKLDGKYDLESRGSAFFCTPQQETTHELPKHLHIWYCCGFKGVVFLRDFIRRLKCISHL